MSIKKSINKLSNGEVFALYGYVKEHYAALKLTDDAFAVQVTTELGFEVNAANVINARQQLGIEGTRDVMRAEKPTIEALLARIVKLEERCTGVEQRNADLLARMTQKGITELVDREYGPTHPAGMLVIEVVGNKPGSKTAHNNGRGAR